jgi:hypothetical protein
MHNDGCIMAHQRLRAGRRVTCALLAGTASWGLPRDSGSRSPDLCCWRRAAHTYTRRVCKSFDAMDGAIKLLFKHAIEALHASISGAAGDGAAAAASGNWKSIIKGL